MKKITCLLSMLLIISLFANNFFYVWAENEIVQNPEIMNDVSANNDINDTTIEESSIVKQVDPAAPVESSSGSNDNNIESVVPTDPINGEPEVGNNPDDINNEITNSNKHDETDDEKKDEVTDNKKESDKDNSNKYVITFIDSIDNSTISEITVSEQESATPPDAPQHDGYIFKEWSGNYTNIMSDETVTAIYEEKEPETVELVQKELKQTVDSYVVTVKGNMPDDTILVVKKTDNKNAEEKVSDSLGDDIEFVAQVTFDITLEYKNKAYQPTDFDENVIVTITGVDTEKTFDVYRVTDDDIVTNMNASNNNDTVEFVTDHFTVYTVGETILQEGDYYIVNVYLDGDIIATYGAPKPSEDSSDDKNEWADDYLKQLINDIYSEYDLDYLVNHSSSVEYLYNYEKEWFYDRVNANPDNKNNVFVEKGDTIEMQFVTKQQWLGLQYTITDTDNDGIKETLTLTGTQTESVLNDEHIKLSKELDTSSWTIEYFDAPFYTNDEITNIEVKNTTLIDLCYMFSYAPNIEKISFTNCDISTPTYFNNIFTDSKKLISITTDDITKESISKAKPTTMANMFSGCESLKQIDFLEKIDTSEVTDVQWLFYHCYQLDNPAIGNWNTSKVENMTYLFYEAEGLTTLDVSNWKTDNIKKFNSAFYGCVNLTSIDTSSWVLNNVEDLYYTFKNCSNLESIGDTTNWGLANCVNLHGTFENCKKLKSLNVSTWNLSNCVDMYYTFSQCNGIQTLDTKDWDLSKIVNFDHTFYAASNLTDIDTSNWNLESVTITNFMFSYCTKLKTIDTTNWNTHSLTTMQNMFSYCTNLQELDVSNWDVSNCIDINSMFANDINLISLGTNNVSNWNTSNMTNINSVFSGCLKLQELDVSKWDVSNCIYILNCFQFCSSLKVIDVSNWNITSKVSPVYGWRYVFNGCSSVEELDLSNWDGSDQTVTTSMLYNMKSLKVLKTPKSMKGTIDLPKQMIDQDTLEQISVTSENSTKSQTLKWGYKVVFKDGIDNSIIDTRLIELPVPGIEEIKAVFSDVEDKLPVHEDMEFFEWNYDETELVNEENLTSDVIVTAVYKDIIKTSYTVKLPAKIELQESDTNYAADLDVHVEGVTKAQSISVACAKSVTYKLNDEGARTLSGTVGFTIEDSNTKNTVTLYSNKDSNKPWSIWESGTQKTTESGTEYYEHNNDLTFNIQTINKNIEPGTYEGTINFFFKEANW